MSCHNLKLKYISLRISNERRRRRSGAQCASAERKQTTKRNVKEYIFKFI